MDIKQKGSTILLRLTLIVIALVALALCIFAFPEMWRNVALEGDERFTRPVRGIIIGLYLSAVPFFLGLWQGSKLLSYIDKNIAFSELAIRALKRIKYYATTIAILMASTLPFFYGTAQLDDAPGVVVIGMAFVGAPIVVAVFAAVLQRLLRSAINMKSENDLTV